MAQILLLEPNTLLAATYREAFHHAGHSVQHVTAAQAAIAAADEQRPDVVVLELQLPEHGGLEFLHEFRSYVDWREVPIIVHTMLTPAQTAFAEGALKRDLGVQAVLYKPATTLVDLVRAVRIHAPAV